jgi:hypothetical protein
MDTNSRLRQNYASAFLGYLTQRDEAALGRAYELGRAAMSHHVSMLDIAQIHHEVFLDVLATVKNTDELRDIGRAAAAFLVEALASFDMTQRGFIERTAGTRRPPRSETTGIPPAS